MSKIELRRRNEDCSTKSANPFPVPKRMILTIRKTILQFIQERSSILCCRCEFTDNDWFCNLF